MRTDQAEFVSFIAAEFTDACVDLLNGLRSDKPVAYALKLLQATNALLRRRLGLLLHDARKKLL